MLAKGGVSPRWVPAGQLSLATNRSDRNSSSQQRSQQAASPPGPLSFAKMAQVFGIRGSPSQAGAIANRGAAGS